MPIVVLSSARTYRNPSIFKSEVITQGQAKEVTPAQFEALMATGAFDAVEGETQIIRKPLRDARKVGGVSVQVGKQSRSVEV